MRKHWMDNLRWVTVLLVLFYHVIYFYNAKGTPGGAGGFYDDQPWDAVMSVLYPWFMMLLFLVAGISSRYAMEKMSLGRFVGKRTLKLLVPSTIGLFVFQWMTGYFNTHVSGVNPMAGEPLVAQYFMWVLTGIGPLWFVQDLWVFSLLLVLFRVIGKDKLYSRIGKLFQGESIGKVIGMVVIGFFLIWAGAQCSITLSEITEDMDPKDIAINVAGNIWNIYRPFAYFVPFLLGYYVFSHDAVQSVVTRMRIPMLILALASGAYFTYKMYGQNDAAPAVLRSWLCNLYAWFVILAMLGCFRAWADKTSRYATYMTKSSYGIYVLHYLVVASLGYMLKYYTSLEPWVIYVIYTIAVMTLPFALNEIIKRIPFIRWCVLGIKKKS